MLFLLFALFLPANVFAAVTCSSIGTYKSGQDITPFLKSGPIQCSSQSSIVMSPFELAVGGYNCPGNYAATKAMLQENPDLAKSMSYHHEHDSTYQYSQHDVPMIAVAIMACCNNRCGSNRQSDIVKLLIDNGADINYKIGNPFIATKGTLLDYVKYYPTQSGFCAKDSDISECTKIEQLLREHGAKTVAELDAEQNTTTANAPAPNNNNSDTDIKTLTPSAAGDGVGFSATQSPEITATVAGIATPDGLNIEQAPTQNNKNTTDTNNEKDTDTLSDDSDDDDDNTLAEKQKAYDEAHEKEQSFANRTLTALTTAATGIGGMELARGLAEQSADKDAAADMAAYIATMHCDYADGQQVKYGPDEIELPGGNNQEMMNLRSQYLALAADLKERKTALGMKPGIESEEIGDKTQTGLYDDESIGITSGNYASLYRAQVLGSESDQAQIDDAAAASKRRVIGGAVAAGAGVVGGFVGNALINGKSEKEKQQDNNDIKSEPKEALKKLQQVLKNGGAKNTDKLKFNYFDPGILHLGGIDSNGTEWKEKVNGKDATRLFVDTADTSKIKESLIKNFGQNLTAVLLNETQNDTPAPTATQANSTNTVVTSAAEPDTPRPNNDQTQLNSDDEVKTLTPSAAGDGVGFSAIQSPEITGTVAGIATPAALTIDATKNRDTTATTKTTTNNTKPAPAQQEQQKSQTKTQPTTNTKKNTGTKSKTDMKNFKEVQVSLDQGKKLIELWAKQNGKKDLKYASADTSTFGQDFITYQDAGHEYIFEFDDLREADPTVQAEGVARAVCLIYKGVFTSHGVTLECATKQSCEQWKKTVKTMASRAQDSTDKTNQCILKVRL